MSRSKWKGGFLAPALLKKSKKINKIKRIWSRNSVISRNFLNQKVMVHGGKGFRFVSITEDKLGLKFGEFSFTRKKVKKNIIKKKKK
jgi:small subunit ribosomal protein S19